MTCEHPKFSAVILVFTFYFVLVSTSVNYEWGQIQFEVEQRGKCFIPIQLQLASDAEFLTVLGT